MAEQVTFRDFAMASMEGDGSAASGLLATLLGVDEGVARAATTHFRTRMAADPAFMMKAMGMRSVVEARDHGALVALLAECFGLPADVGAHAAGVVLARTA